MKPFTGVGKLDIYQDERNNKTNKGDTFHQG